MSREYEERALANAIRDGLTAGQVEVMGYPQIAALAEVPIERDGSSPRDFFYRLVRQAVVNTLAAAEDDQARDGAQTVIQAAARQHWNAATVECDDAGVYLVDLHEQELPPREQPPALGLKV